MNPFLGYFVFVDLGDGCLGSKYGNTINPILMTESATLVSTPGTEPFIGEYVTTWIDNVNPVEFTQARLIISKKTKSGGQYSMIWHQEGNSSKVLYHGEGMIYEGSLVGSYWNEPVHRVLRV